MIANVIVYPAFTYFSDTPLNPIGFNPPGLVFGVVLLLIVFFDIFYLQSGSRVRHKKNQAVDIARRQLFPLEEPPAAAPSDENTIEGLVSTDTSTATRLKNCYISAKEFWSENFGPAEGKYFFGRIFCSELIEFSLQLASLSSLVTKINSVYWSIAATVLVLNAIVPLMIIAYGTGGDVYRNHVARELCLIFELFSDIFYLFFNLYVLSVESAFFYQICK